MEHLTYSYDIQAIDDDQNSAVSFWKYCLIVFQHCLKLASRQSKKKGGKPKHKVETHRQAARGMPDVVGQLKC
jgi:hypothetical protein